MRRVAAQARIQRGRNRLQGFGLLRERFALVKIAIDQFFERVQELGRNAEHTRSGHADAAQERRRRLTVDDGGWYWGIWLSGIGIAVVLCIVGLAIVMRRGFALKARLEAYANLPVLALARRTQVSTSHLPQTIADGAQLLPRMQRALVDLQEARDNLERSAARAAETAKAVGAFFSSWRKKR